MDIDPGTVKMIVTALIGGGAALAKGGLSQAGKDAYEKLKSMITDRADDKGEAALVLAKAEQKPDKWQGPLEGLVEDSGAADDAAIVEQAREVLKIVQPQQIGRGKYNINIGEAKGSTIGDGNTVTQRWND